VSGERPKLLLLHGFLSSRNAWGPLQRELSDVETLAPDILGYGDSGSRGDDYSLDAVLGALDPIVRRERPTHVIGHSMGGIVALALGAANRHAIEGVGVIGLPVFHDRTDGKAFLRSRGIVYRNFLRGDRFAHYACRGLHRTSRAWLPFAPLILPRQPREVLRTTFDHGPSGHGGGLDRIVFAGLVESLADDVRVPVFALHGSRDRTAPLGRARELAARKGWDFRLARNVGHQLPIERPHLAARWLREYVLASRQHCIDTAAR
jgi:pimeloyl-ACP methyl ester carboxylesterase